MASHIKTSYSEAKAHGLKRYHGKLCEKHPELLGERFTRSCNCLDCHKIHNNSERHRKTVALWRKENPQRVLDGVKRWHTENHERYRITKLTAMAMRRARKRNLAEPLTKFEKLRIRIRYAIARYLTKSTENRYVVDHIYPLSKGGRHHPDNLQVITERANKEKGNRVLE